MSDQEKFALLRKILQAFGLSAEAVDDIINRILEFLSDKDPKAGPKVDYPYRLRDDFLSPAEASFFHVLRRAVEGWALACPKVALGDLFFAQTGDHRANRISTNRIDRKHVDFLLIDPQTARPILGIELDDKSHQRADRKQRDLLVEGVFAAAQLPLARVPVQHGYNVAELQALLREKAGRPAPVVEAAPAPVPAAAPLAPERFASPICPKCGGAMALRTAKTGTNQGSQFWGCAHFPKCRGIVAFQS